MKVKHFTASAVIMKNNKVLLIWHNKLNTWLYPGGHIDENENPEDAILREVKEEIGIDVKIIGDNNKKIQTDIARTLCNPYIILEEKIGLDNSHFHIDMIYLCTPISYDIRLQEKEVKKYKWCTLEEVQNMEMFENLKLLLIEILSNNLSLDV